MQKTLILFGLVVVVGAGAHWYLATMSSKSVAPAVTPATEVPATESDVDQPESGATAPVVESASSAVVPAPVLDSEVVVPVVDTAPTEPAPSDAPAAADITTDLDELDALFAESYDDSSLDADFETNLDESYGF